MTIRKKRERERRLFNKVLIRKTHRERDVNPDPLTCWFSSMEAMNLEDEPRGTGCEGEK